MHTGIGKSRCWFRSNEVVGCRETGEREIGVVCDACLHVTISAPFCVELILINLFR